jgi:hypothetical protein
MIPNVSFFELTRTWFNPNPQTRIVRHFLFFFFLLEPKQESEQIEVVLAEFNKTNSFKQMRYNM